MLQQGLSELLSAIESVSDLSDPVERVVCGVRCHVPRREHLSLGSTRVCTEHEAQLHLSCLLWMLLITPDPVRRVWQLRDMPIDAIQSASRVIMEHPCICELCCVNKVVVDNPVQSGLVEQQQLFG